MKSVVWLTPSSLAISAAETPIPLSRKHRREAVTICSSVVSFGLPTPSLRQIISFQKEMHLTLLGIAVHFFLERNK
ncbi:MAG: hypothetical protein AAGE52_03805 [Myxococcota bacterium]